MASCSSLPRTEGRPGGSHAASRCPDLAPALDPLRLLQGPGRCPGDQACVSWAGSRLPWAGRWGIQATLNPADVATGACYGAIPLSPPFPTRRGAGLTLTSRGRLEAVRSPSGGRRTGAPYGSSDPLWGGNTSEPGPGGASPFPAGRGRCCRITTSGTATAASENGATRAAGRGSTQRQQALLR